MSEILNGGFYLQTLWEDRDALAAQANFDLNYCRRLLATFQLAAHSAPSSAAKAPETAIDLHLLAVYTNLMQRGLPTLASLRVELTLLAAVAAAVPIQQELTTTGGYHFTLDTMNRQARTDWRKLLVDAHLLVDPRLQPEDRLEATVSGERQPFGSECERQFFTQLLPAAIGPAATMLAEPQRALVSMVERVGDNSKEQRVDLALATPTRQVVYEVDGPQHLCPKQQQLDAKRDQVLRDAKWHTKRIPVAQMGDSATLARLHATLPADDPYLAHLAHRYAEPLWATPQGAAALQLVLGPFAVARLQRALLVALDMGGCGWMLRFGGW